MSRVRRQGVEVTPSLKFCLMLGPMSPWDDDLTDEDLEVGWRIHGETIMERWELRDASRPWAWWGERGEDPPAFEPGAKEIRLAELGELTDDEYAALAKRATEAKARLDSVVILRGDRRGSPHQL